MTEDEARVWITTVFGTRAVDRLGAFVNMVVAENERQNLIAPSTIGEVWNRHVLDSAQLVPLGQPGLWIDIGTGAGFPGMIVALLQADPVLLVEPRTKRAAFLAHCATKLSLDHVTVRASKIDSLRATATTISARAVAPVEKLLHMAAGCATTATRWLLPRGRSGAEELAGVRQRWRGVFHVQQSLSDPASSILICEDVRPR